MAVLASLPITVQSCVPCERSDVEIESTFISLLKPSHRFDQVEERDYEAIHWNHEHTSATVLSII